MKDVLFTFCVFYSLFHKVTCYACLIGACDQLCALTSQVYIWFVMRFPYYTLAAPLLKMMKNFDLNSTLAFFDLTNASGWWITCLVSLWRFYFWVFIAARIGFYTMSHFLILLDMHLCLIMHLNSNRMLNFRFRFKFSWVVIKRYNVVPFSSIHLTCASKVL